LLLPLDADPARGRALRDEGWVTVAALEAVGDWRAEAHRLGCDHILENGQPVMID
jgi:ATP phosphoribosyltransferase regulatory subunit